MRSYRIFKQADRDQLGASKKEEEKRKKKKTVIYKTSRYDFQSVQSHPKTFVNLSKFYLTEVFVFDIYVRGDGIRSDYSINLKTIFVEPFSLLHLLRSFDCNWFMIMFSNEKRKQTNKLKVSLTIREIVNVLLSFPKMFLLTPARRANKTIYLQIFRVENGYFETLDPNEN